MDGIAWYKKDPSQMSKPQLRKLYQYHARQRITNAIDTAFFALNNELE